MGAKAMRSLLCLFLAAAAGLPLAARASRMGGTGRELRQLCGGCIPVQVYSATTTYVPLVGTPSTTGGCGQPGDRFELRINVSSTTSTSEAHRNVWVTVTRDGVDVTATILQGDALQTLNASLVEAVVPAPSPNFGQYIRVRSATGFAAPPVVLVVGRDLGTPGLGPGLYITNVLSGTFWTGPGTATLTISSPSPSQAVTTVLQAWSSTGVWSNITPTTAGTVPLFTFSEGHTTPVRLCATVSGGTPTSLQLTVTGVTGAQLSGSPLCYQLPASFFTDGGSASQTHTLAVQANFACGQARKESAIRVNDICSSGHALVLTSSSKVTWTSGRPPPVFTMTANFTDPGTTASVENHALRLQLLRSGTPVDFAITSPTGGTYNATAKAWTYTVLATGTRPRAVSIAMQFPTTKTSYTVRATYTDLGNAACTAKTVPITSAGKTVTLQVA